MQCIVRWQRTIRRVWVPIVHEEKQRAVCILPQKAYGPVGELAALIAKRLVEKARVVIIATRKPAPAPFSLHNQVVASNGDITALLCQLRQKKNLFGEVA